MGGVGFARSATAHRGKPCGGRGGKGGDVYFKLDANKSSLNATASTARAESGMRGNTNLMDGKSGTDLYIPVPMGTCIVPCSAEIVEGRTKFIAEPIEAHVELTASKNLYLAARGGAGGKGNFSLGLNNNECEKGKIGETKRYILDLKTIADVGLVGAPNAGKSSFLSAVSNAHPKVAPYPFTTLNPFIGVVQFDDYSQFTVADIPGLIKGAHKNVGLGHAFLKHIMKSSIIGYVIDASLDEPWNDLQDLMSELEMFSPDLIKKRSFIIANKIDKGEKVVKNAAVLQLMFPALNIFPISAKHRIGIRQITNFLKTFICQSSNDTSTGCNLQL